MVSPLSYRSPKTEIRDSSIHGRGLFATERIAKGEVVCVKGGYVLNSKQRQDVNARLGPVEIQIGDGLYIAPVTTDEREGGMLYLNHSCDANAGLRGDITFVAMRDISAGQEITHDWCMTDDDSYELPCNCGSPQCRAVLAGKDWQKPELQKRYLGFFSSYLAAKFK